MKHSNHLWRLVIPVLFAAFSLSAQTIDKIIIRSATSRPVSEQIVRANMELREGALFSSAALSEDIKRLYATGQYEDIVAGQEKLPGDKINLILTLKPRPTVTEIVIQGNERVKEKKLRKKITQFAGDLLHDNLLAKDLAALYEYYEKAGYKNVRIDQRIEPVVKGESVRIVYDIDEGTRAKVRGVDIIGNTALSNHAIKKVMDTGVSFWGYIFPTGFYDRDTMQADLDKVAEEYWGLGYLDVQVSLDEPRFNAKKSKVYLTIRIEEGQPYTVSSVAIKGNAAYTTERLMTQVLLKPDTTYSQKVVKSDIDALTRAYNSDGYLDSSVRVDRIPDGSTHRVGVTYNIHEGTPSSIRNINISGNRFTKDEVIRRELEIQPGDKSDSTKIDASKSRLQNLGYFSQVAVVPISTSDPGLKDLDVQVEEQPTGRLGFGVGVSSSDSFVGTIELAQTNFDLQNPPTFRGGGQRLRLRATLGSSRQDYTLSFTEPWLFDRRLRLDTDFWKRSTSSNRNWDQDSYGAQGKLTWQMPYKFWRQYAGYRIESIDISNIDSNYSKSFIDYEESSEIVSSLLLGFVREHRDRLINPRSGNVVSLQGELQSEAIGSYSDIYKLRLNAAQYWPLIWKSIFKVEGEISEVDTVAGGDEPHVYDRYFAGGIATLRGFPERDVGPYDPANQNPVGGKSRALGTVELLKELYGETIYMAFFTDFGNVWADSWEIKPDQINVGSGIGFRLFLPVGAFQIDYGWPVVRDQDNLSSGGRLHFSLGYTF